MKKIILFCLLLTTLQSINAQTKAVTETGDEVLLHDDGSWQYIDNKQDISTEIPTNHKNYKKDKTSNFLVKSKKLNVGIWINSKTWSFSKGTGDDVFEFQFQKKEDDLYGMLIAEKMEIPLVTLKGIALANAKSVAPDIKVMKEEYRTVNGLTVLMMQMTGTIQGVKFTYYGYYYSNSEGTIQLLTYTGDSLFKSYIDDIESFLNGFVEL